MEANDDASRAGFLEAARRKYDFEPDPQGADKAVLYRLEPR